MRVLIAGGGTGGHLFPALAVARTMQREVPGSEVLFVGTERGIEAKVIPQTEFPIRYVTARGLKSTGLANLVKGFFELPTAMFQSMRIVREFRPHVVLGVGGYASGPTVMAAAIMGTPTAIQEQNSVMGTTNRVLARFVRKIFVAWEDTEPAISANKTVLTGNPVRADLLQEASRADIDAGRTNILIFGGSRGARSINLAIMHNVDLLRPLRDKISIVHQCGVGASEEVADAYGKTGLEVQVKEFIERMGPAYAWADLVVCRSGASSLAEITALGKPAIVIPYPHAIGDHQAKNAAVLESGGAVHVVPDHKLKNGALVSEICRLVDRPDELSAMSANSLKFGKPHAAATIVQELLKLKRSAE